MTNYGGIIASHPNAARKVIVLGHIVVGLVLILMRMRMLPLLPRLLYCCRPHMHCSYPYPLSTLSQGSCLCLVCRGKKMSRIR